MRKNKWLMRESKRAQGGWGVETKMKKKLEYVYDSHIIYFIILSAYVMERASINHCGHICHCAPHWYSLSILTWVEFYDIFIIPIWIEMLNTHTHQHTAHMHNKIKYKNLVNSLFIQTLLSFWCAIVDGGGGVVVVIGILRSIFMTVFFFHLSTNSKREFCLLKKEFCAGGRGWSRPSNNNRFTDWKKQRSVALLAFVKSKRLKFNYHTNQIKSIKSKSEYLNRDNANDIWDW